jgi:hypothetical protein
MVQIGDGERYYIDEDNFISLKIKVGDIKCDYCGYLLGTIGDGITMFRTTITLYDDVTEQFLMRCGKCKKFTVINKCELTK